MPNVVMNSGTLFVVATPIGNLGDLSDRARHILAAVDVVAAEDTRRTGQLLASFGCGTPTLSLHEHNEAARIPDLLARIASGSDVALVSDAGTPLLADPGYRLVRAATEAELTVRPVPGASAITSALSVAGLATDRFLFAGFLPARSAARREAAAALARGTATLVLFEAPHRIAATLSDLRDVLGGQRLAWVGRELTKRFESHRRGPLVDLARIFADGDEPARGEFVIVVDGADGAGSSGVELETSKLLAVLLEELPASRAARVAARLTGARRSDLYEQALALSDRGADSDA